MRAATEGQANSNSGAIGHASGCHPAQRGRKAGCERPDTVTSGGLPIARYASCTARLCMHVFREIDTHAFACVRTSILPPPCQYTLLDSVRAVGRVLTVTGMHSGVRTRLRGQVGLVRRTSGNRYGGKGPARRSMKRPACAVTCGDVRAHPNNVCARPVVCDGVGAATAPSRPSPRTSPRRGPLTSSSPSSSS